MARAAGYGGEFRRPGESTGEVLRVRRDDARDWERDVEPWSESERARKPDARKRLSRLERLAWVLDRSIPIGRWRVGLDPILGLIPGFGDVVGAVISLYIVYEAARLGAPGGLLARMTVNVLIEAVIGAVPLLGDLFDAYWKASTRNLALLHRHHSAGWRARSMVKISSAIAVMVMVMLATIVAAIWWLVKTLMPLMPW